MRRVFLALVMMSLAMLLIGCVSEQGAIAPTPAVAEKASGEPALYHDPKQPVEARIKDLLARMTTEEKIGQMMQPTFDTVYAGRCRQSLDRFRVDGRRWHPRR